MPTFPDIKPSYGSRKTNAPDFRIVKFADGYEHRIVFGLPTNQNPKNFNFTWNVSETEADTIEAFLDQRKGIESFDYTPAGESSAKKFVCDKWDKSDPYLNRAIVNATFREVFEP